MKEKNSFPPKFEVAIYYGILPSDSRIGTFVLDLNDQNRPLEVFAADDDFPDVSTLLENVLRKVALVPGSNCP